MIWIEFDTIDESIRQLIQLFITTLALRFGCTVITKNVKITLMYHHNSLLPIMFLILSLPFSIITIAVVIPYVIILISM